MGGDLTKKFCLFFPWFKNCLLVYCDSLDMKWEIKLEQFQSLLRIYFRHKRLKIMYFLTVSLLIFITVFLTILIIEKDLQNETCYANTFLVTSGPFLIASTMLHNKISFCMFELFTIYLFTFEFLRQVIFISHKLLSNSQKSSCISLLL